MVEMNEPISQMRSSLICRVTADSLCWSYGSSLWTKITFTQIEWMQLMWWHLTRWFKHDVLRMCMIQPFGVVVIWRRFGFRLILLGNAIKFFLVFFILSQVGWCQRDGRNKKETFLEFEEGTCPWQYSGDLSLVMNEMVVCLLMGWGNIIERKWGIGVNQLREWVSEMANRIMKSVSHFERLLIKELLFCSGVRSKWIRADNSMIVLNEVLIIEKNDMG
jgi:hypothetical protein